MSVLKEIHCPCCCALTNGNHWLVCGDGSNPKLWACENCKEWTRELQVPDPENATGYAPKLLDLKPGVEVDGQVALAMGIPNPDSDWMLHSNDAWPPAFSTNGALVDEMLDWLAAQPLDEERINELHWYKEPIKGQLTTLWYLVYQSGGVSTPSTDKKLLYCAAILDIAEKRKTDQC